MVKSGEEDFILKKIKECHYLILYGGSGVGKTFLAKKVAKKLSKSPILINLHKGYDYNEFVSGTRVKTNDKLLQIEDKPGIFQSVLKQCKDDENASIVIILDDLHRVNLYELFGDKISFLEQEPPRNLYIIGTYNTVVCGSNLIDYSIYHRFYFYSVYSDLSKIFKSYELEVTKDLIKSFLHPLAAYKYFLYENINNLIQNYLNYTSGVSWHEELERYKIGHSFFVDCETFQELRLRVRCQVVPLLEQYFKDGILMDNDGGGKILLDSLRNETYEPYVNQGSGKRNAEFVWNDNKFKNSPSKTVHNTFKELCKLDYLENDDVFSSCGINCRVIARLSNLKNVPYLSGQIYGSKLFQMHLRRNTNYSNAAKQYYNLGKYQDKHYIAVNGIRYYCPNDVGGESDVLLWQKLMKTDIPFESSNPITSPAVVMQRMFIEYCFKYYILYYQTTGKWLKYNMERVFADKIDINSIEDAFNRFFIFDDDTPILQITRKKGKESMGMNIFNIMKTTGIHQVILQGPPGTSKTYVAKKTIYDLLKTKDLTKSIDENIKGCRFSMNPNGIESTEGVYKVCWDIVQFHPAYTYEDFIRGITVRTQEKNSRDKEKIVTYETENKLLGRMADEAIKKENAKTLYFLIIDEINRANIANVLGELIYALEYRGCEVTTPYTLEEKSGNKNTIQIPDNLFIIGTMNTADKSIGVIDYAVRRRFIFIPSLPNPDIIPVGIAKKFYLDVERLFDKPYMSSEYNKDDVQVGHTYFLEKDETKLKLRFQYQVLPLLKEYVKDTVIQLPIRKDEKVQKGKSDNKTSFDILLNMLVENKVEDLLKEYFEAVKNEDN